MPIVHELSAVKWAATRARAPPLCVVSALFPLNSFFRLRGVLSECPSSTQTLEKQADFFGPFPNFPKFSNFQNFSFFSFFSFFPFRFFRFFGGFEFPHFPFFGVGAFPRKPSPSPGFIFLPPRPLSNLKPLTQNGQTQWKMQPYN